MVEQARPEQPPAGSGYRTLRRHLRELAYRADVCLPALSPLSDCRACADACPVDALDVAGDGVSEVSDACVRCGRCAAVCPTGALQVTGFFSESIEVALSEREPEQTVAIDCWRVPREASPAGAMRVPCLGGLDGGRIAELQVRAGAPVRLLDRGWCGDCPAGDECAGPPVEAALHTAREALAAASVRSVDLPAIESAPLDGARAAPAIPTPLHEQRVDRRQFFRRAFGLAARTADDMQPTAESTAPRMRIHARPALPRQRLVAAVDALGGELPAALSPAAVIDSDACRNHRVCAAICPTKALGAVDTEEGTGIDFDPAACIQCGICERVCPEQAIGIHPRGGAAGALTRHHTRSCRECQRDFVASDADREICPACRRDRAWFTGMASA